MPPQGARRPRRPRTTGAQSVRSTAALAENSPQRFFKALEQASRGADTRTGHDAGGSADGRGSTLLTASSRSSRAASAVRTSAWQPSSGGVGAACFAATALASISRQRIPFGPTTARPARAAHGDVPRGTRSTTPPTCGGASDRHCARRPENTQAVVRDRSRRRSARSWVRRRGACPGGRRHGGAAWSCAQAASPPWHARPPHSPRDQRRGSTRLRGKRRPLAGGTGRAMLAEGGDARGAVVRWWEMNPCSSPSSLRRRRLARRSSSTRPKRRKGARTRCSGVDRVGVGGVHQPWRLIARTEPISSASSRGARRQGAHQTSSRRGNSGITLRPSRGNTWRRRSASVRSTRRRGLRAAGGPRRADRGRALLDVETRSLARDARRRAGRPGRRPLTFAAE